VNYFKKIGFTCPDHSNPLDYMISIMHSENKENIDNYPIYFEEYAKEW
jgi:hypothetical protein